VEIEIELHKARIAVLVENYRGTSSPETNVRYYIFHNEVAIVVKIDGSAISHINHFSMINR